MESKRKMYFMTNHFESYEFIQYLKQANKL